MRRAASLLSLPLLAAPLAGCSEPPVAGPAADAATGPIAIKGRVTSEFILTTPPNDFCGYGSPTPYRIKVEDGDSSGQLSNIGRVTQFSLHCTADMSGTPPVTDGRITWTNSEGDALSATYSGRQTSAPDADGDFDLRLTGTIDGGTGSFSAATGEVRIDGVGNLSRRTLTLDVRGEVSLNGGG